MVVSVTFRKLAPGWLVLRGFKESLRSGILGGSLLGLGGYSKFRAMDLSTPILDEAPSKELMGTTSEKSTDRGRLPASVADEARESRL